MDLEAPEPSDRPLDESTASSNLAAATGRMQSGPPHGGSATVRDR